MNRLKLPPETIKEGQVVDAGTSNPFASVGLTSVDVLVEPSNAATSCNVAVFAYARCEEVPSL